MEHRKRDDHGEEYVHSTPCPSVWLSLPSDSVFSPSFFSCFCFQHVLQHLTKQLHSIRTCRSGRPWKWRPCTKVRSLHCLIVSSIGFSFLTIPFSCFCFHYFFLGQPRHWHTPTAFYQASIFNQDLSKWNTAKVTTMEKSMFTPLFILLSGCFFHQIQFSHQYYFLLLFSLILVGSTTAFTHSDSVLSSI